MVLLEYVAILKKKTGTFSYFLLKPHGQLVLAFPKNPFLMFMGTLRKPPSDKNELFMTRI